MKITELTLSSNGNFTKTLKPEVVKLGFQIVGYIPGVSIVSGIARICYVANETFGSIVVPSSRHKRIFAAHLLRGVCEILCLGPLLAVKDAVKSIYNKIVYGPTPEAEQAAVYAKARAETEEAKKAEPYKKLAAHLLAKQPPISYLPADLPPGEIKHLVAYVQAKLEEFRVDPPQIPHPPTPVFATSVEIHEPASRPRAASAPTLAEIQQLTSRPRADSTSSI